MDIDLGLLGAVCREGMSGFLDEAVTVEMLDGSAVVAFKYIEEHWKNYRDVPTIDTVYKETGLNFHTVPVEPMKFWSDQIKKRHLYETIKAGLEPIMTFMEEVEPHKVVSEMESLLFKIRSEVAVANRPEPLFKDPEAMFADLEQAKQGIIGVPTPWPTLNKMTRGWQEADFALIAARPGVGKSLHPETEVIMVDGSLRQVQYVSSGDQLLGPDSKPRNVLGVHRGREEMFEVIPNKGDPWKCNRSHILSLKMSSDNGHVYKRGQIFNLSIDEYLAKNNKFKHHAKLWRTAVEFPKKDVRFDPYLIGLWLGDGGMNQPTFTFQDPLLIDYLTNFASKNSYKLNDESTQGRCSTFRLSKGIKGGKNPFLNYIRDFAVKDEEKRIPIECKINSREQRLKLLAGLLDTDGYLQNHTFEIITKYKGLCDDVLFLARSLGFSAYSGIKKGTIKSTGFVGYYYRVNISGDVDQIPCLLKRRQALPRTNDKNVLFTGFKLKSLGEGEYFGVELDGDHLYLLGDFTVTHNTWVLLIIAIWAWENGKKVLLGSTEMSHKALRRRAAALFCRLSYSKIRDGTLTLEEEEMFREKVTSLKDDKRFLILGDGFDVTLNSLEAAIIEEEPDLVGADGAYLFKSGGNKRDRHEGMADLFNGFKQIAKRNKVPIIGTTQMNRADKQKGGAVDLSRMAFSDNAGMVADWVFFLKQTKEMKQNREMELQPGKMRESDYSGNIRINFDFGIQNFTEVEDTTEDEPLNKAIGVLDNMEFPTDEDEPF